MKNLILLHGAMGSPAQFSVLTKQLESSYKLYLPAFNGHGLNTEPSPFNMELLTAELIEYVHQQQLQQPLVFGYSMGGYVALLAQGLNPGLFGKVYTLATKYHWTADGAKAEAAMLNPDKIKEKVPSFAQYLQQLHGNQWENLCVYTGNMMLELGQHPLLTPDLLKDIQIPVCIGVGDRDKMVSIQETQALYQACGQAAMQVLPYTQHPLEKVNPEQLANALHYFYNR